MKVNPVSFVTSFAFDRLLPSFALSCDNDVDHQTNSILDRKCPLWFLWCHFLRRHYTCGFLLNRFFHHHKMKWSRHYSTSRLSWLCLLAVHSVIEMGVWVLLGRKSACQLAFSALFPISIKHLHHLLWAHSSTPCFPLEPCTSDRWRVLGTSRFSSRPGGRLTLSSFQFLELWLFFFSWTEKCSGNFGEDV